MHHDVLIIGGGTAGLGAYRYLTTHGNLQSVALIEPNDIVTTCANVGCMPSKLLIAAAEAHHTITHSAAFGFTVPQVEVNQSTLWGRVRAERDRFVGFVKEGAQHIKPIKGYANFVDFNTVDVTDRNGEVTRHTADAIVLATGSTPIVPDIYKQLGDALLTNENIFELTETPKRVAVIGAGVIGLELGMALNMLGSEVHLYSLSTQFLGLNSVPNQYFKTLLESQFHTHWERPIEVLEKQADGTVKLVDAKGATVIVDKVLVAIGRRPNFAGLETLLEKPPLSTYNRQTLQIANLPIFMVGDVNGDVPLLHEASYEGGKVGEQVLAYLRKQALPELQRWTPLSIVFTHPQVASIGNTEMTNDTVVGSVSFENQGRSRVMLKNKGLAELYFDVPTRRLKGAQLIGPSAEHLAHLLTWAIESHATVDELINRPFYHPVVEEGLKTAIRDAYSRMKPL